MILVESPSEADIVARWAEVSLGPKADTKLSRSKPLGTALPCRNHNRDDHADADHKDDGQPVPEDEIL